MKQHPEQVQRGCLSIPNPMLEITELIGYNPSGDQADISALREGRDQILRPFTRMADLLLKYRYECPEMERGSPHLPLLWLGTMVREPHRLTNKTRFSES